MSNETDQAVNPLINRTIRLDGGTIVLLQELAQEERRSFSDYVRVIIEDHLDELGV